MENRRWGKGPAACVLMGEERKVSRGKNEGKETTAPCVSGGKDYTALKEESLTWKKGVRVF